MHVYFKTHKANLDSFLKLLRILVLSAVLRMHKLENADDFPTKITPAASAKGFSRTISTV